MSLEENKAIVRRWIEAANKQDQDLLDSFVAPHVINHTRQIKGREGFMQYITKHFETFPDFHVSIEDIVAEEDKVWIRIEVTGTYEGEHRGLTPTGKKMKVRGVQIYRLVDDKTVGVWTDYNFHLDQLEFSKKLGLIEYTEAGKQLFPEG
jgi:steroid delta-isomerase-like uncharacterized protein